MIGNLSIVDSLVVLIYFAITLLIVIYFLRDKEQSKRDYFLAGRSAGWVVVGLSLFATNISSEHIVGLAGSGASDGLVTGQFEWFAIFILLLLGWIFAPIFLKSKVYTIPQYFGLRYDKRSAKYLTVVSIIAYILTKISITLFAGGLLLREVLGWDMLTSTVVMVLLTGVYTVAGGMTAVLRTNVFQGVVIILGASLLTYFGLGEVGGFSGLAAKLPVEYFELFKPISDPNFPWTGIIFGAPILAIWYWCTDQYIVQRILSAKSIEAARKGTILTAFLKILPVFIFVLPGLIAIALYPGIQGDDAYPFLITSNLLPIGIKGIVVASVLAALMSSLSSVIHSTATLYTFDIYKPKHLDASDQKLVLVGRLAATVIVVSAILWVPLIKMLSSGVYLYLQRVQAYIAPPIAAVFLLGIFWKKANSTGAAWALISGGIIGFLRLMSNLLVSNNLVDNSLITAFAEINYLHFAIILFLVSASTQVVFSLISAENGINEKMKNFYFGLGEYKLEKGKLIINDVSIPRIEILFFVSLIIMVIFFWGIFA